MSLHAPAQPGTPTERTDAPAHGAALGRTPGRDRILSAVLFLLPAAVASASIWNGIGGRQLWRDEHATWWAATLSFGELGSLIRSIDVVFTPYYVLMHLWVGVAGDSATALRVPGALAMAAAAGLLALLGRRMFTPQVGLLAGLAFAVVPAVTRYGQEVRPYAFAVAAVLLSTLLLVRALEQPTFRVWVGYTLSIPLVGWSHLASLAVLAPHLILVVRARRAGDRIVGWAYAAAGILGLCFVLPMVASGAGQSGQIAWNNPGVKDLLEFPAHLFGSWAVAVPVMVLGLIGLCFTGRRALPLALWIVLPPVATFVTAAQLHLFLPRYLFFTAPAWVLLASVAVCRITGRVARPPAAEPGASVPGTAARVGGWVLVAAAAGGLAFQALPGIEAARGPVAGEPDFRGAAGIVRAGQRERDGIVFAGELAERRALAYELRDDRARPADVLMDRTPQELGSFGALECPEPASCLSGADRLWLVSTSPDPGEPFTGMPERTARAIRAEFKVVRTDGLDSVRVLLLERIPEAAKSRGDDAATRKVHS
ncbi:glycosyltransferase family 39 protein [Streptomyces sp. NPDC006512]|uniref:glycosyltransferase family 39 protein n=1 Tax=Streptomyces sp. NPDC006512 TaxID=3154307 RepID=UPI00339F1DDE